MASAKDVTALSIAEVALRDMGFDIARLGYFRWLVSHQRDPELAGIKLTLRNDVAPAVDSQETLRLPSRRLNDTRAEWS